MKKIYGVVFLILCLINSMLMYAMLATTQRLGARQPGVMRQAERVAVARQTQQRQQLPAGRFTHTGSAENDRETVKEKTKQSGWFSWLWGSGSTAQGDAIVVELPSSKQSLKSKFFAPKKLTPQEFVKNFEENLYRFGPWTAPNNRYFNLKNLFDTNDLQNAKTIIDKNEEYINQNILDEDIPGSFSTYHWGYATWQSGSRPNEAFRTNLRIADRVLDAIFRGEPTFYDHRYFYGFEMKVRLIELLKYVIEKGGQISSENKPAYKAAYLNVLMPTYKNLYTGGGIFGTDYEIETTKKIFLELDPILEYFMPEFKDELRKAQKERAQVEANPQAYKEKIKDKHDREAYVRDKRNRQKIDYAHQYGYRAYEMRDDKSASWYEVQFDEKEYQQWLKNGRSFHRIKFDFSGDSSSRSHRRPSMPKVLSLEDAIAGLNRALKLPKNTTEREMWTTFKKVRKEDHSDKVQPLIDAGTITQEEGEKRIVYYTDVMSAYNAYKAARKAKNDEKIKKEEERRRAASE